MKDSQPPKPISGPSPSGSRFRAGKDRSARGFSRLKQVQSLTRLVIGGVEYGIDELLNHLEVWEEEVARDHPEFAIAAQSGGEAVPADDAAGALTPDAVLDPAGFVGEQDPELTESQLTEARFALIGWIFDVQDRLSAQHTTLRRVERLTWNILDPLTRPVRTSRLFSPVQKRFDRLVARGQSEFERWAERGRQEDARSRALAKAAFTTTVDDYIDYLTTNPEVQELVQLQSTSLATEVVEEVRERTVSADTFLEGITRSLLKRVPRSHLPEPPPEVRAAAVQIQKAKKHPSSAAQLALGPDGARRGEESGPETALEKRRFGDR